MMARLLWQTWHDSWKMLPLPILVAGVFFLGVALTIDALSGPGSPLDSIIPISAMLFVPSLYGAMAFSNDQRRGRYRFLAEHAARPRYVWFARHIVWLSALAAVSVIFALFVVVIASLGLRENAEQSLEFFTQWGHGAHAGETAYDVVEATTIAQRAVSLAGLGFLAAYGIGQLCSMLMRSEILAAFVALVLSVVLSAWVAALFVWQLSGWLFLLPIAIGLLAATWLRAPSWIADRRAWQTWIFPALAIVAPVALVALVLSIARLEQIPKVMRYYHDSEPVAIESAISNELTLFRRGITPVARETADMYLKAAERLEARPEKDLLEPWSLPEYESDVGLPGDIDESKIPRDRLDAFKEAMREQIESEREVVNTAIDEAIKISARPSCHFDFDLSAVAPQTQENRQWELEAVPLYRKVYELLGKLVPAEIEPNEPFERSLAALRMSAHLRSGQPSVVFLDQLSMEQAVLRRIGRWALQEDRTKDELRDAFNELTNFFQRDPNMKHALLADHLLVRDAILGKETPLSLALAPNSPAVYLAFVANELPWERERAILALDRITLDNLRRAKNLSDFLSSEEHAGGIRNLRRWLRPTDHWNNLPPEWLLYEPAAATSYLTRFEYQDRVPIEELNRACIDNRLSRRAALLYFALGRYRLDNDAYPARLSELIPKYLDQLPVDPYTRQPFQYEPMGLEFPFQIFARDFGNAVNFSAYTGVDFFHQTRIASRIEPHTPFLWSGGAGAKSPRRSIPNPADPRDYIPDDEVVELQEPTYYFRSDQQPWWNDPFFIFPLAK